MNHQGIKKSEYEKKNRIMNETKRNNSFMIKMAAEWVMCSEWAHEWTCQIWCGYVKAFMI